MNVARLRGERSQKGVADAMRERGWKWSQATVWAIEKGERPLRLVEADDLATVLGVHLHNLLQVSDVAEVDSEVRTHVETVVREYEGAIHALTSLQWTKNYLVTALDEAARVPGWSPSISPSYLSWVLTLSAEKALEAAAAETKTEDSLRDLQWNARLPSNEEAATLPPFDVQRWRADRGLNPEA